MFKHGDKVKCILGNLVSPLMLDHVYIVNRCYEDRVILIGYGGYHFYSKRFELVKRLPKNYIQNKGENCV